MWTHHILFIHLPVDGYLGSFTFWCLWIMLLQAFYVQVFMWSSVSISLGETTRSGIAGIYGNFMFNLLRNCQIVFQTGCTYTHCHQQYIKALFSSQPHHHLLLSVFCFIRSILIVWNSISWSTFSSRLMMLNISCATSIVSLEKGLFRFFAHF